MTRTLERARLLALVLVVGCPTTTRNDPPGDGVVPSGDDGGRPSSSLPDGGLVAVPGLEDASDSRRPGTPADSGIERRAKRVVFIYTAHGTSLDGWKPAGPRDRFALGTMLAPLRPFRDRMVMVDGLDATPPWSTEGQHCSRVNHFCPGSLLSGTVGRETGFGGFMGGNRSIDVRIGQALGGNEVPHSAIVLSSPARVHPYSWISYDEAHTPIVPTMAPSELLDRLAPSSSETDSDASAAATPAQVMGRLTVQLGDVPVA